MLALPTEPCRLPQRLLHQRRRIHEHLDLGAARLGQRSGDALQAGTNDVMIILPSGVAGNGSAPRVGQRRQRIALRRVAHAEHDDRSRLRPHAERVPAAFHSGCHPRHVAMAPLLEELREALADGRSDGAGRRHARGVESGRPGLLQDQLLETFGHMLVCRWRTANNRRCMEKSAISGSPLAVSS